MVLSAHAADVTADVKEVRRLSLQIERDVVEGTRLKVLLTLAHRTLAERRKELRTVKRHMARTERARRAHRPRKPRP